MRGAPYVGPGAYVDLYLTALSTSVEAEALLFYRRYAYPDWLAEHSRLVGRIATLVASALSLDVRIVGLGGYLHDAGRSPLLAGDGRDHGDLGALVLAAEGLRACAELARRHPVYAAMDPATAPRSIEEKVVSYADRRGGMRVMSVDERVTETALRHPRYADGVERSRPAALAIEREIAARLPFAPDDLARELERAWPR